MVRGGPVVARVLWRLVGVGGGAVSAVFVAGRRLRFESRALGRRRQGAQGRRGVGGKGAQGRREGVAVGSGGSGELTSQCPLGWDHILWWDPYDILWDCSGSPARPLNIAPY